MLGVNALSVVVVVVQVVVCVVSRAAQGVR